MIHAAFPSWTEVGFTDPIWAIADSQLREKELYDTSGVTYVGKVIRSIDWQLEKTCLHGDTSSLLFTCYHQGVCLTPTHQTNGLQEAVAMPNVLRVTLAGNIIEWNVASIIHGMVGNVLMRITPSQHGYFLSFSQFGIVSVELLLDSKTGVPFLFWTRCD